MDEPGRVLVRRRRTPVPSAAECSSPLPTSTLRSVPSSMAGTTAHTRSSGSITPTRSDSFSRTSQGLLRDHAVARLVSERHAQIGPVIHTSLDSTPRARRFMVEPRPREAESHGQVVTPHRSVSLVGAVSGHGPPGGSQGTWGWCGVRVGSGGMSLLPRTHPALSRTKDLVHRALIMSDVAVRHYRFTPAARKRRAP